MFGLRTIYNRFVRWSRLGVFSKRRACGSGGAECPVRRTRPAMVSRRFAMMNDRSCVPWNDCPESRTKEVLNGDRMGHLKSVKVALVV